MREPFLDYFFSTAGSTRAVFLSLLVDKQRTETSIYLDFGDNAAGHTLVVFLDRYTA